MKLYHRSFEIPFPPTAPPTWAARVERWYQLDSSAYLLAEAFSRSELEATARAQILACPESSNATDAAFVSGGAVSPTKFVHTLPNIRSSSLLAVMGWSGSVLCLHRNPGGLAAAFREAMRSGAMLGETWLWHITGDSKSVELWIFAPEVPIAAGYQISDSAPSATPCAAPQDMAILGWFRHSEGTFHISEQWVVQAG